MDIRGLQKVSLLDLPGGICSTIFTGGCNLRCPYCHNRDLVLNPGAIPEVKVEEVLAHLEQKSSMLDGVCISGGEPTLQENLLDFLLEIKKLNLKIKLDTNGTRPEVVGKLLEKDVLDYVAMDVKGPLEKYSLVAGKDVDQGKLKETISLLESSTVRHEFRTTVVPGLLKEEDILSVAGEIAGCRCYVLQQFHPRPTVIDPDMVSLRPYSREKVAAMANLCREHIEAVQLRGF
ncbi:MAG: anaerobic ribonucleoside-triphosphate reductase activating protein [Firmicutes bacterium]|nr:anaerobic ribonucleoside-triphosphate reductase activating protein [Bacillota bacterium]